MLQLLLKQPLLLQISFSARRLEVAEVDLLLLDALLLPHVLVYLLLYQLFLLLQLHQLGVEGR